MNEGMDGCEPWIPIESERANERDGSEEMISG